MVLECKEDCGFEEILSVSSNFTTYSAADTTKFALNAITHLPAEAAFLCPYLFDSLHTYEEANISFLLNNISKLFSKYYLVRCVYRKYEILFKRNRFYKIDFIYCKNALQCHI